MPEWCSVRTELSMIAVILLRVCTGFCAEIVSLACVFFENFCLHVYR